MNMITKQLIIGMISMISVAVPMIVSAQALTFMAPIPATSSIATTTIATTTATSTAATSSTSSAQAMITTAARISSLLAQIAQLRAQMNDLIQEVITLGGVTNQNAISADAHAAVQPIVTCPVFSRAVGIGMQGSDIRTLQQWLLSNAELATSSVTGYFGQTTRDAIIRLQKKAGIDQPTGFVGKTTQRIITQSCASSTVTSTPTNN